MHWGVALGQLSSLRGDLLEVKDVWMLGLDLMSKIKSDRQQIRLDENEAVAQPEELAALRAEIAMLEQRVRSNDEAYNKTIILDEDRRLFDVYKSKSTAYEQTLEQVLGALAAGQLEPALRERSSRISMRWSTRSTS